MSIWSHDDNSVGYRSKYEEPDNKEEDKGRLMAVMVNNLRIYPC